MLRLAAFLAYLASWLVLALVALRSRYADGGAARDPEETADPRNLLGLVLQSVSALPIVLGLDPGPLRPAGWALAAVLVLAPLSAGLFLLAMRAGQAGGGHGGLVKHGPFALVRHPVYLAFLLMLVATGLLAGQGAPMLAGVVLYVAGTECRTAVEEASLRRRFAAAYDEYRAHVRWRYLPGLR